MNKHLFRSCILILATMTHLSSKSFDGQKIICGKNSLVLNNSKDSVGDYDTTYAYLKEIPQLKLKIFVKSFCNGECKTILAVDENNCTVNEIDGEPIYNEKINKIAVHGFDVDARYYWNGIKIFKYENRKFIEEFSLLPDDWGPVHVMWFSDSSLFFFKMTYPDDEMSKKGASFIAYAKVVELKNGKWIFKE